MTNPNIPDDARDVSLSFYSYGSNGFSTLDVKVSFEVPGSPINDQGKLADLIADAIEQYRVYINSQDPNNTFPAVDVEVFWSVPNTDTITP